MKFYLSIIFASLFCCTLLGAFDASDTYGLKNSKDLSLQARLEAMREINLRINSALASTPNADRPVVSQKIKQALEEIKSDLLAAAKSEDEGLKSLSVQILRHSKIDELVTESLERIVMDESLDGTQSYLIGNALYALAESKSLSPSIQQSLVSRLQFSAANNNGLFPVWAKLAGFGKVEGAVPILAEALLSGDSNIVISSAKSLKEMGPLAKNVLPILEELKAQKKDVVDFRELEALDHAIIVIKGSVLSQAPELAQSALRSLDSVSSSKVVVVEKKGFDGFLLLGVISTIIATISLIFIFVKRRFF
jgi:hypothetical protein